MGGCDRGEIARSKIPLNCDEQTKKSLFLPSTLDPRFSSLLFIVLRKKSSLSNRSGF